MQLCVYLDDRARPDLACHFGPVHLILLPILYHKHWVLTIDWLVQFSESLLIHTHGTLSRAFLVMHGILNRVKHKFTPTFKLFGHAALHGLPSLLMPLRNNRVFIAAEVVPHGRDHALPHRLELNELLKLLNGFGMLLMLLMLDARLREIYFLKQESILLQDLLQVPLFVNEVQGLHGWADPQGGFRCDPLCGGEVMLGGGRDRLVV